MKTTHPLLLALFMALIVSSCDKRDISGITAPLSKPDLTVRVTSSVTGFVTGEAGEPLAGASVKAGDLQAVTDEYGYFSIDDATLPAVAGFIKVEKAGYFSGYKTFQPTGDAAAFLRLQLLPKKEAGAVDAATGGTVTTTDGVKVSLPAGAVVKANNQAAYDGNVHLHIHRINPADVQTAQLSLPGDDRGTDNSGFLRMLQTFSSIAVELTGNSGERLQLAAGQPATIELPIPAELLSQAPATVDLWSFNESNGLWQQEGTATRVGNSYLARAGHFSFWSGATGYPLVNFQARIVNSTGQPLVHVPVMITMANQPKNAGFGKFAYTDANGLVQGAVLSDRNLVLDILTPCATSAYTHAFTATHTDIDLGTLTGNLGQSMVTISGTVTNCSNAPVANGYIQTYDNGFYNRIPVANGQFNFTGLACTNTEMYYVAVDMDTKQQSAPQSRTLAAGINDLGALSACGISMLGVISYRINNGEEELMEEPAEPMGGFYATASGGWTSVLTLGQASGVNPKWSFQFSGPAGIAGEHQVIEVFSPVFPGGRAYAPIPLTVTLTEYGQPGGFIAGSFSGLMLGFSDNSEQQVTCQFRIKRMN